MFKQNSIVYRGLFLLVVFFSMTQAQWVTTRIDTLTNSITRKAMAMQALAIDNSQTLHAVWTERYTMTTYRILYSYKNPGSSWSVPELVADTVNIKPVIAVEPNTGHVHIAYTVTVGTYPELFYATNRTGTWVRTRLTTNNVYDQTPTIAVKDSTAHIAWITIDSSSAYKIAYGRYSAGNWNPQILRGSQLGGFGLGAAPYLALEPTGIAHISYRGGDYGTYHIHHAENPLNDTAWLYQILYTVNANDFSSALAAKSQGEIFLVASGNDGWGMPMRTYYLHRPPNSSTWETADLMTGDASAQMNGFALDEDFVHISWERVNGNLLTEEIYHCSNFSGNWFNSGIRPDGQTSYGALVIDNNHCGHCLVVSGANIDSQQVYCINSGPMFPLRDVAVNAITAPSGGVIMMTTLTPSALVHNYGEISETFKVVYTIAGPGSFTYADTQPVILAAGAFTTVNFDSFHFDTIGTANLKCYVGPSIAGDTNLVNDTARSTVNVYFPITPPPWATLAPIPTTPSGKNPKAGSCMAGLEATGKIYFLRASNKPDFAGFTPAWPDVGFWVDLETIPKGDKVTFDGKYPKKGASMAAYDPKKCLFVLRGNNTQGFWKYQADTLAGETLTIGWKKMKEIPMGLKRPKDASGVAWVTRSDNDYIFTMKGSKTDEFYFYNIEANTWSAPLPPPPAGTSGRVGYKKGSCLAYDGEKTVYVLKGNYGDFFMFDLDSLKWTELTRYDKRVFINRDGKKKAPKDGASLVFHEGFIYMLKGGNTCELWKYKTLTDTGTWLQMNPLDMWDIPLGGGKKVKAGGAMIKFGDYFYAAKGGNTSEFYGHELPIESVTAAYLRPSNQGTMDNKINSNLFKLTITPNPAINLTTVNYSLSIAEPVSFKLYNVAGSMMKTYTNAVPSKNGLIAIDAKALPSGVYILRFNAGDIRVTRKLVLEK